MSLATARSTKIPEAKLNACGAGDEPEASAWGCTCQGLSDAHDIWPGHWGNATAAAKKWWLQHDCSTGPASAMEDGVGVGENLVGVAPAKAGFHRHKAHTLFIHCIIIILLVFLSSFDTHVHP